METGPLTVSVCSDFNFIALCSVLSPGSVRWGTASFFFFVGGVKILDDYACFAVLRYVLRLAECDQTPDGGRNREPPKDPAVLGVLYMFRACQALWRGF